MPRPNSTHSAGRARRSGVAALVQRDAGCDDDQRAGNHEEPGEHRERRKRGNGRIVVEIRFHAIDEIGHVGIDGGPLVVEIHDRGKHGVVLRGLDRARRHECVTERFDRLGVGSVDLDEVTAEAFDLFDRHVRLELLDHVATEGRPIEHLEHERRHDHPDPDDQRSDDRQVSTSRLHDTPVRGPIRPVPIVGPPRPPLQGRRSRSVDRTVRARSDLDEREANFNGRSVIETLRSANCLLHRQDERLRLRVREDRGGPCGGADGDPHAHRPKPST